MNCRFFVPVRAAGFCSAPGGFRALVLLLTVLVLVNSCCAADVTEAWVSRYSNPVSNSVDRAFKIGRDSTGAVIVTGASSNGRSGEDILTIKYSGLDGALVWQQRYNGPANGDDSPRGLAVDLNDNVIVAGYSHNGTNDDFFTAKYAAADGALLWSQRYDGQTNSEDGARALAVDANGDVIVTGYSGTYPNEDFYTVKYAGANGAVLWEKRYDGITSGNDEPFALALDAQGNAVVTGRSNGNIDNADYYTAKYAAADGALLWEKRYNSPANGYDQAAAVTIDLNGNVIVTGLSEGVVSTEGHSDFYTAKYAAATGTLLWERRFDGPVGPGGVHANDYGEAILTDGSGNVIVVGSSEDDSDKASPDFYTAKYAAGNGAILWQRRYAGPTNSYDYAMGAVMETNGDVIVVGRANGVDLQNGFTFYAARYAAASGAVLWETNGTAGGASAVAMDGPDHVVITGTADGGTRNDDFYTAKYAAQDGSLVWEQRQNGPGNHNDQADAVIFDGGGNVVVTGSSHNGDNYDYLTAKYAAQDGALLWTQRYNGLTNGDDQPRALAVDPAGNVLVTGSVGIGYDEEEDLPKNAFYTAKYAALDGALLWEKMLGRTNGLDQGRAVAVDTNGDVIVTGLSRNDDFDTDYYTAKLAGTDGAILWEKIYDGGRSDEPFALAVDAIGDVVVTGSSGTFKYAATNGAILWQQLYSRDARSGDGDGKALVLDANGTVAVTGYTYNGTNGDYYIAKYAAENGALLWEQRFNGPSNANDFAQAVALDHSGNVVVTGFSGPPDYDIYTLKYAAADGTLLWTQRFNGFGEGHDEAHAVAIDDHDNAIVTASSFNGVSADYYTVKYAAADGSVLWEKRYDSPDNGTDMIGSAYPLAMGAGGRIAITGSSGHTDSRFGGVIYDYATVLYQEPLDVRVSVAISLVPLGVSLHFAGVPGKSYQIERAATVTGPWLPLAPATAASDGSVDFIDSDPLGDSAFYRVSNL